MPPRTEELELKFEVPAGCFASVDRALRRGQVGVARIRAIYFDTPDGCLGAHGVALRLRQEGDQWVQTAKADTSSPIRRLEHNVLVPTPDGDGEPRLDVSLHDREPVGDAIRRAMLACRSHPLEARLVERFRSDVLRTTRTVRVDGARVALSCDQGELVAGSRSSRVSEFELELKSGDAAALFALAKRWSARHGLWLSTASKAERGMRLARGEWFGPPVFAPPAPMDANPEVGAFLVATIEGCMKQVLGNASAIGAGALDEELVHQLRVGLLHLRTVLNEFRAKRFGARPAWAAVLRRAFRELGAHRDLEVVMPALMSKLNERSGLPLHGAPTGPALRSPLDVVRDPALQQTLLDVLAFIARPLACPTAEPGRCPSARALVAAGLSRLRHSITDDVKRFSDLTPDHQHRVRKRIGRLLCIGAAAEPLYDHDTVERYLAKLMDVRSRLGEGHDLLLAAEALHSGALQGAGAHFAARWLRHQRRKRTRQSQRALRRAMNQPVFWRP